MVESFFATPKTELVAAARWTTRAETHHAIADYRVAARAGLRRAWKLPRGQRSVVKSVVKAHGEPREGRARAYGMTSAPTTP